MSYERLAYDDQDTTVKMHTDCNACASEMDIPEQRVSLDSFGVPDIAFAAAPQQMNRPVINVNEATTRFANGLQLHLD